MRIPVRLVFTLAALTVAGSQLTMTLAQTPTPPAAWEPFAKHYDPNAPLMFKGVVMGQEYEGPRLFLIVREGADGPLWRADAGVERQATVGKLRERVAAMVPGTAVQVRGYRALNTACAPYCLMALRDARTP